VGNSSAINSYSFTDHSPSQPNSFYRLKQIDLDYKYKFSKVLAIRFSTAATSMVAFPNPAAAQLNVQLNVPAGPVQVRMFNAAGQVVKSFTLQSPGSTLSTYIDMSDLAPGTYVLRANDQQIKIIKN
jgi:hypothetical protein